MKAPYLMLNLARGERGVAPIGEALRGAREGLGLTVEQAAVDTRISARFLEALEMERFEDLPADVYVRGFIRSYAAYLRLDPIPLLATFEYAGDSPPHPSVLPSVPPLAATAGPRRSGRPPSPWLRRPRRAAASVALGSFLRRMPACSTCRRAILGAVGARSTAVGGACSAPGGAGQAPASPE